jgi:hypothetical protein
MVSSFSFPARTVERLLRVNPKDPVNPKGFKPFFLSKTNGKAFKVGLETLKDGVM